MVFSSLILFGLIWSTVLMHLLTSDLVSLWFFRWSLEAPQVQCPPAPRIVWNSSKRSYLKKVLTENKTTQNRPKQHRARRNPKEGKKIWQDLLTSTQYGLLLGKPLAVATWTRTNTNPFDTKIIGHWAAVGTAAAVEVGKRAGQLECTGPSKRVMS